MDDFFTTSAIIVTLASAIRAATPFLFASLGETLGQRSGVLNLGVEGVMLLGAFAAYYTVLQFESYLLGLVVAMAVGAVMGLLYGLITLVMKAEQGISGIGIFLFGLGFTDLVFQKWVGTPKPIARIPSWDIPVLGEIPVVGEIFFQHNVLVYLAFCAVPVMAFVINRTTFGLNVRAVGETPAAADTLGVSVNRTRLITIVVANIFAAVGGAAISLDVGNFQQNITAGRGFIAIALVYFGAWRPFGALAGSLLFGFVSAVVTQLGVLDVISGPASSLAAAAPAVLTIVMLVVVSKRIGPPAALTRPFDRSG